MLQERSLSQKDQQKCQIYRAISITAQSKDSLRRGKEAPSSEASGDVKGVSFVEQLGENKGPRNVLASNLREDLRLNISNIFSSLSRLRSLFTALFWSGLWASFTVFFGKIQP